MTKRTGKPRGRPAYQPTDKMRKDVAIWRAGGMSVEAIGRVLDMDSDTVRKHFKDELETGWAKVVAKVVEARYKSAVGGNVSAQTKFLEGASAVGAEEQIKKPEEERKVRVQPLGKKELANETAKSAGAGTDWGKLLQPRGTIQ